MRTLLFILFLAFTSIAAAFAADDMKAFPPAEKGMDRYVIRLQKQKDETGYKVEIIIGLTVRTDAINHYFFGGTLETESIPGWGYNRYVLLKLGPMAGTLMAVDPSAPKVDRFVSLGSETILPYNSRLPLVIYVPAEAEVRYRLWRRERALLWPEEPGKRGTRRN